MALGRHAEAAPESPRPRKIARTDRDPSARSSCTAAYIPEDVIFDILSRLPVRSLLRFKSVCKAWRDTISDPRFVRAHLDRSKKRQGMLLIPGAYSTQKRDNNVDAGAEDEQKIAFLISFYKYRGGKLAELLHLEDIPGGFARWDRPLHCDGLALVCTSTYALGQEIVVCNPATREFVTLPKGSRSSFHGILSRVGLGFDPCSNTYKVARYFYQEDEATSQPVCRFEVLTLGTKAWRRTADPPYAIAVKNPAVVRGAMYWMLAGHQPRAFLRFSLADEEFGGLVPYPSRDADPLCFIALDGELCCACLPPQSRTMEFWVCSNTESNTPTWTLRGATVIPEEAVVERLGGTYFPLAVLHGKMLFLARDEKVYCCSLRTGRIERIAAAVEDIRYYDPTSKTYRIYLWQKELDLQILNYAESLVRVR